MNRYDKNTVLTQLLVGIIVMLQSVFLSANDHTNFSNATYNHTTNYKGTEPNVDQCFASPERAYAYLIAQDKARKEAEKLVGISSVVDINTASEAQFNTLKGIGSKKAQAIVRYRQQFGAFSSVDELTKVKGIGDKTIKNNRSRLIVSNQ